MRQLSLVALLLFNTILAFGQYTPSTVPNVKLINNSYVSNPDSLIRRTTVAEIDSILSALERQTTAQIAVVVVKSIGDTDITDFSQELFRLWGIGGSNSNGLLVMFVESPHGIRLHTGYQLEGMLPDVVCKEIEMKQMVPSFKAGDYDGGILNGINEVVKILTDPAYAEEIKAGLQEETVATGYSAFVLFCSIFLLPIFLIAWAVKNDKFSNSKEPDPTDFPQMRMKRATWLTLYGGVPLLIIVLFWIGNPENAEGLAMVTLYLYMMGMVVVRLIRERIMFNKLREKRKFFEMTDYLKKTTGYWFLIAILFPFPFIAYLPLHFVRRAYYRNHPRKCTLCEGSMKRLNEEDDDQFLTKSQLIEEQIDSINYDVWQCKECSATEAWHFVIKWSGYEECKKCKSRTWYLVHDKTLKAATYSSSGKGESLYQCKVCGHSQRKGYTIAMLTHSESSSSSSSSSSSWSSSSSSSSSGGSWGGGSSGGGGASSSW